MKKVMLARQAGAGDLLKHLADDAAQRLLGENVVADQVFAHLDRLEAFGKPWETTREPFGGFRKPAMSPFESDRTGQAI